LFFFTNTTAAIMAPAIRAAPPTDAAIMIQSGIDSSASFSELPFKTLDDGTGSDGQYALSPLQLYVSLSQGVIDEAFSSIAGQSSLQGVP